MQINEKIKEYLDELNITHQDGIPYLLALKLGYKPSYIPDSLKQKVNATGIVFEENGELIWKVELFEGQEEGAFSWVKDEYVPLFKAKNSSKGGKVREATIRMKKLFTEYPDIRKEDVLGATKMYLLNTDVDYIRFPHFFIFKGTGADKVYDIVDWVEKYRLSVINQQGRTSKSNILQ